MTSFRRLGYLLGTMNPGDSFAMARVKSRSFSEKDIVTKRLFEGILAEEEEHHASFSTLLEE